MKSDFSQKLTKPRINKYLKIKRVADFATLVFM